MKKLFSLLGCATLLIGSVQAETLFSGFRSSNAGFTIQPGTKDQLLFTLRHTAPDGTGSEASGNAVKLTSVSPLKGSWNVPGGEFTLTETFSGKNFLLNLKAASPVPTQGILLTGELKMNGTPRAFYLDSMQIQPDVAGMAQSAEKKNPKMIRIPMDEGELRLTFTAPVDAKLEWNKEKHAAVLNLLMPVKDAAFTEGSLEFQADYAGAPASAAVTATPLDLSASANMSFVDDVEGDQKGGWTDQGPGNDLRKLPAGTANYGGITFRIADPAQTDRCSLVLKGKAKPFFPSKIKVPVDNKMGKYLYLLHGLSYPSGGLVGTITFGYADGTFSSTQVTSADVSNFWNPNAIEKGVIGWKGTNGNGAGIGLYVTSFPVEKKKPLKSITLRSAGNSIWMIAAMSLSDAMPQHSLPVIFTADNKEWFAFDCNGVKDIVKGSILDFSRFADAPAGKYGEIKVVGDHFEFEKRPGVPAKFYGANIYGYPLWIEKKYLARMAEDFANTGYNIMRLHHYDHTPAKRGDSTVLDPNNLDKIDYLIAELKKRGVYLTTDLYCMRQIFPDEISDFKHRDLKDFLPVHEGVRANWEKFATNLLNHVNPYTGLAWKDDPTLVGLVIVNEPFWTGWVATTRNPQYVKYYGAAFRQYLKKSGLPETMKFTDDEKVFRKFLYDLNSIHYNHSAKFLHELGVKAPLSNLNCDTRPRHTWLRRIYDYVDDHYYWAHPIGGLQTLPVTIDSESAIQGYGGFTKALQGRIISKPFTCSEWDFVNPNPYNTEAASIAGAYSAFQGIDRLERFAYSNRDFAITKDSSAITQFCMANDPMRLISERAGILFFLRGDVKKANLSIPFMLPSQMNAMCEHRDRWFPEGWQQLGTVVGTGVMFDDEKAPADARMILGFEEKALADKGVPYRAAGDGWYESLVQKDLPKGLIDLKNDVYTSCTGELTLNRKQNNFKVVTPKSEGFTMKAGQTLKGNFAEVSSRDTYAAFLIASLEDDKPLAKSGRILITHLTDVKNTGMRFKNNQLNILEKWGTTPQLFRKNSAVITLAANAADVELFACGLNGARINPVPVEDLGNGRLRFQAENCVNGKPVFVYELVRKNAK